MSAQLEQILQVARQFGASDIHMKVGLPPVFRIGGDLRTVRDLNPLSQSDLQGFATAVMKPHHEKAFESNHDVDLAHVDQKGGRYRINLYQQRGVFGFAMRVIPLEVPPFERLNLPEVVLRLANEQRGLVLVTGATGSGKSTTLASIIHHINKTRAAHIITIEDPIEYVHKDHRSIVNQRELDLDAVSFARALRSALRQDPDVILVGEMRDLDTIETALIAAETGHLVLSTIHTVDAVETINRVVAVFPAHQQTQVRLQIASVMRGVISQRLIPRADGRGLVPAVEVMVGTERVRQLIETPERTREIHEAIANGRQPYGMIAFDQCLAELVARQLITQDEAIKNSSRPDDIKLVLRGYGAGTNPGTATTGSKGSTPKQETKPLHGNMEISRFGSK